MSASALVSRLEYIFWATSRRSDTSLALQCLEMSLHVPMCPTLDGLQPYAEPTKIRLWIQNLSGVDTKRHRGVGDVDHVVLLGNCLIDVVYVTQRRIP